MNSMPILFAASSRFPTVTVFIIALALVVTGAFIWAAFIREPGKQHSRHRRHHWRQSKPGKSDSSDESHSHRRMSSKKRRRRRKERPSNPTLAETGGLPPKRSEGGESH